MGEWKLLQADLNIVPGWRLERKAGNLDLLLNPDVVEGKVVPRYDVGVEYSEQDLIHYPYLNFNTVRLSNGLYWSHIFTAWTPEELEEQFKKRYPITSLPPDYKEKWQLVKDYFS